MKRCCTTLALALLALAPAVPALADHTHDHAAAAAPEMGAEQKAMMEAWEKAKTPGAEHQQLANMAGDWTFTNSMWMDPGKPPMESTGTMHGEMMMGGRYLSTDWHGSMMGQPFEGHGVDAYDNVSKQYQSSWVDNQGTGIMYGTGSCEGMTCSSESNTWDPMTGKPMKMRSTVTWAGKDGFTMKMYAPGPDGKEMQMMEIVAKRKT